MDWLVEGFHSKERGAALIIVLAFVVLFAGLGVAYFSRTTSDRQVANSSFNQSSVDQLAQSAMDSIVGDLRQEIINGSTAYVQDGTTIYIPTAAANMLPQRSGNAAGAPNLIRRSVNPDSLSGNPAPPSRASAVNSQNNPSANGRFVTSTRWNGHYLVPKKFTSPPTDDSIPIDAFTNATPDWVFVTPTGATVLTSPNSSVVGRYSYAVYDEGGLLDMNVAGYPTNTAPTQSGRKGSAPYADLTALASSNENRLGNPDAAGVYQMDRLVGWRNYATTQPSNAFPDTGPPANRAFAYNFQGGSGPATLFSNSVLGNTNGFLSPNTAIWNNGTDQIFVQRQELIAFRKTVGSTTSFSANVLQYLSTFSRETNAPSFSPPLNASEMGGNDQGGIYAYRTNATSPTAVNPNFLSRRVPSPFTRFDGTSAVVGEPLVKTRFPLSRLAWITYKGPSASLATTDPVYLALRAALVNAGYSAASATSTINAGTVSNIQACFGLTFVGDPTFAWTYSHGAANRILGLNEVAGRDPDFFELLQAGILSGSLGQNTAPPPGTSGGGTTGGNVFPDVHMASSAHHILSIGAAIIDQADPDSIPSRIQFTGSNGNTWTAYGDENLPYITKMYPLAGASPNDATHTKWATYLLFQLWNPHQNAPSTLPVPVRLRVDGGVGIFMGGNGETWNTSSTEFVNTSGTTAGQSATLNTGANAAASFSSVGAPVSNQNTTVTTSATPPAFSAVLAPAIPTPTP